MAADPASPSSKPKASIKRVRIGVNVILQIALVLTIVLIVNWLSCQHHKQWDRSPSKRYSLGQQTQQVLDNLSEDLYLTVAFGRGSDVYPYTQRMIGLYEKAAKGRLKVTWVDPLRDPAAIEELRLQDPKLIFEQNKILISKAEKLNADGETSGSYEVVTEKDMFQRGENTMFRDRSARRGRVIEYRLERALTSGIAAATQETKQAVYIVTSKGNANRINNQDAGNVVQAAASRQNLEVKPFMLTPETDVPDDAGVVMLISPSIDFTGAELQKLFADYWEKRRGGLILLYNPLHHDALPNLRTFIEKNYGVRLEDDRVLGMRTRGGRNIKTYEVPSLFMADSPITEPLANRPTTLPGRSCSVNTRIIGKADDPAAPKPADKKSLLLAFDDFWKEKDYNSPNPVADARETTDVYMAASVELGAGINQDLRLNSSRMVVVGNGNLLDPPQPTLEAVEFVLNCINWATDREELVTGIDVQTAGKFQVEVGERPFDRLERMTLRIVPGLAFLIGLVVAFFRRR